MAGGRPTSYNEQVLADAYDYLENYKETYGDLVPMVVGLCGAIKRGKSTVYEWQKDDDKQEFSDILNAIQEMQEKGLVNGGLSSSFNPAITKMLLAKHGYSDSVKTDITSAGEQLGAPVYTIIEE